MLIHVAQLKSRAPQECIKGKALTRTLVYKFARATSCTAQADCKGGPSFRFHWSVNAEGCAMHVPTPFARCMHTPSG